MPRWPARAVVAIVLLLALPGVAVAQPDQFPDRVDRDRDYSIRKSAFEGEAGCEFLIAGKKVGTCQDKRGPLEGVFRVPADHPPGRHKLFCRNCHEVVQVPPTPTGEPSPTGGGPTTTTTTTTSKKPTTTTAPPNQLKIPSVVGLSFAAAKQKLAQNGWTGPVDPLKGKALKPDQHDKVIEQNPKAGSPMPDEGDAIQLVIGVYEKTTEPQPTSGGPGNRRFQPQPLEIEIGDFTVIGPSEFPWALVVAAIVAVVLGIALWGIWRLWRRPPSTGPPPPPQRVPGVRPVEVGISAPPDRPLVPGRQYTFWIEIGALDGAIGSTPVPMDIVVHGPVADPVRSIRLGRAAAGRFEFPFTATGQLRMRCGLYVRGVLQQSFVVNAGMRGWYAERDYAVSFGLDPARLATVEPHAMSLLVNHNDPYARGLFAYFDGQKKELVGQIPYDFITAFQTKVHELYRGLSPVHEDWHRLTEAFCQLAVWGRRVFTMLHQNLDGTGEAVWAGIRDQVKVQVVWPRGDAQPLPAPIVYDYPMADQPTGLCRYFIEDIKKQHPPRCAKGVCVDGDPRVVCPAGFWGFRLAMGSPLSRRDPAPDKPARRPHPPTVIIGKSNDPRFSLREQHLENLAHGLKQMIVFEENTSTGLLERWRDVPANLIYLYCHGGGNRHEGMGWFEVGGKTLSPDILPMVRWTTEPLVFLNGCDTAALADDLPLSLSRWFVSSGAGGVIGTEVVVYEGIACQFAEAVVPAMLNEAKSVGEAMREARIQLLRENSVLGLCYVAFAPADLRVR